VVVGVLEVELVGLVVAVLRRELRLDLVHFQRLELQPDHRPSGVLGERLIDLDTDLLAGRQFALEEVVIENFFRERLSHSVRRWAFCAYKSRVFRNRSNRLIRSRIPKLVCVWTIPTFGPQHNR